MNIPKTIKVGRYTNKLLNYKWNGNDIYSIAFVICLFVSWIISTTFMQFLSYKPLNLLLAIAIGLMIFKIYLLDDSSAVELFLETIIIGLSILSEIKSHSNLILIMTLLVIAARSVDLNHLIYIYYIVGCIVITAVMLYSLIGIITNLSFHAADRPIRYALGIVYPTDLSAHVLFLILANVFLNRTRLTFRRYAVYLFILIATFKITDGRLSCTVGTLAIIAIILADFAQNGHTICRYISSIYWVFIPAQAYLIIILSIFFSPSNKLFAKLDRLLSGRLYFGHEGIHKYGFHLFGNTIEEHGYGGVKGAQLFQGKTNVGYFYIDSSYVRLFLMYGTIMALLVIIVMTYVALHATINNQFVFAAIILAVSSSCMVEQHLLELSFNPFLIVWLASLKNPVSKDLGGT